MLFDTYTHVFTKVQCHVMSECDDSRVCLKYFYQDILFDLVKLKLFETTTPGGVIFYNCNIQVS